MGKRNDWSAFNVIEFYDIATTLKQVIRSGWKKWNVPRERLESVAEHVYGTCILAIAMWSEYSYKIDIRKVIMMLSIHELEETIISDITPFDGVTEKEKLRMGHEAVCDVLSPLFSGDELKKLIFEFDRRKSKEAKFAYQCDKLECDLMAKFYDGSGDIPLENATQSVQDAMYSTGLVSTGAKTMSDFFYEFDKTKYDENFLEVLKTVYNK